MSSDVAEPASGSAPAVLVIDGENFPPRACALAVDALGALAGGPVRAVVVCARSSAAAGWRRADPAATIVLHDCTYRGAGDMLVAMEAQRAAIETPGAVIAIASADRDFAAALIALRAQGHVAVVVTSNVRPPDRLVRAADHCLRVDLPLPPLPAATSAAGNPPPGGNPSAIEVAVAMAMLRTAPADGWAPLGDVGVELQQLGIKVRRLAKVVARHGTLELRRDGCVLQVRRRTVEDDVAQLDPAVET